MPMRMWLCRGAVMGGLVAGAWLAGSGVAAAQYSPPAKDAVGEDYHVEVAYGWWSADPELLINSESLGIAGSDIDLINDLGIQQKKLGKLDVVLRPAKKHRFRIQYLPVRYEADTVLRRSFVFNGQRYDIGLPVQTDASFNTTRFGYEYDFIYRKRGFFGVLFDVKYTDVNVNLLSPIGPEYTSAVAPVPTIGFVGRAYPAANLAVGGEMSFFRTPENLKDTFDGSYTDYDFYGTLNFNKYVGAQVGYRSIDIFYAVDEDSGSLRFKGMYFSGVVRF